LNLMNAILVGGIATASLVAAVFFLKFWRATHDRFFLLFALSFAIEGVNRVALHVLVGVDEDVPLSYGVRLVSYSLILFAILQKNRRGPAKRTRGQRDGDKRP
jgi:hypothetical protein